VTQKEPRPVKRMRRFSHVYSSMTDERKVGCLPVCRCLDLPWFELQLRTEVMGRLRRLNLVYFLYIF
jgi:hypothetical protein